MVINIDCFVDLLTVLLLWLCRIKSVVRLKVVTLGFTFSATNSGFVHASKSLLMYLERIRVQ